MNNQELRILVNAKDNASAVLDKVRHNVDSSSAAMTSGLSRASEAASKAGEAMLRMGKLVATAGAAAVAAGVGIGFNFNNSLEQAQTKLMAFTKDGAQVAKTLEWVKQEASKTQFSFTEMADAAANLTPVSKSTGKSLEVLIRQAEVLAALNPTEGLTGAVFSLREALSGDFVSIVDRFNLPRKRLNELKEQGVPALEAISTALKEMGIDQSLVEKQGQTTAARFDQIKDKFTILAGELTKPIFDKVSLGLFQMSEQVDVLVPQIKTFFTELSANLVPKLLDMASAIGDYLGPKLTALWNTVKESLPTWQQFYNDVLVPVANTLGTILVGAIGLAIDAINLLVVTLTPVVQWLLNNESAAKALAAAFVVLAVAMNFNAIASSFSAAMASVNASFLATKAIISSPVILPAIGVAAMVASLVLVYNEAQKVKQALKDLGAAEDASGAALSDAIRQIQSSTRLTPDQKAEKIRQLGASYTARATGGPVSAGVPYTVGEQRPELFVPNTQGRVEPRVEAGGGETTNILSGTFNFSTKESVDAFFSRLDKTQRLAQVGMG